MSCYVVSITLNFSFISLAISDENRHHITLYHVIVWWTEQQEQKQQHQPAAAVAVCLFVQLSFNCKSRDTTANTTHKRGQQSGKKRTARLTHDFRRHIFSAPCGDVIFVQTHHVCLFHALSFIEWILVHDARATYDDCLLLPSSLTCRRGIIIKSNLKVACHHVLCVVVVKIRLDVHYRIGGGGMYNSIRESIISNVLMVNCHVSLSFFLRV